MTGYEKLTVINIWKQWSQPMSGWFPDMIRPEFGIDLSGVSAIIILKWWNGEPTFVDTRVWGKTAIAATFLKLIELWIRDAHFLTMHLLPRATSAISRFQRPGSQVTKWRIGRIKRINLCEVSFSDWIRFSIPHRSEMTWTPLIYPGLYG
jgi:hypothetical protein